MGFIGARCKATTRHGLNAGKRCGRAPIPFGAVCLKHGGSLPSVRAKAEEEYHATLRGERGFISEWQKAECVRSFERAQTRWSIRQKDRLDNRSRAKTAKRSTGETATSTKSQTAPDPIFDYPGWDRSEF